MTSQYIIAQSRAGASPGVSGKILSQDVVFGTDYTRGESNMRMTRTRVIAAADFFGGLVRQGDIVTTYHATSN